MTCKINADTSDGLKIVSDTSGEIEIQDNGTTRLTVGDTIDIQGTELVLDADADTSMHASTDDQIDFKLGGSDRVVLSTTKIKLNSSGNAELELKAGATDSVNSLKYLNSAGSRRGFISYDTDNDFMFIGVNNAEKARIDSNGVFLVNATAAYSDGSIGRAALQVDGRSGSRVGIAVRAKSTDGSSDVTSAVGAMGFVNGNGTVGGIDISGSATAFNTSSDYRLKENVSYTFDATSRLKQLKPARFNFIADADTTVDGFLAHEVSSIVPEAITGTKDAEITTKNNVINANGHVIDTAIEEADWTAGKADGRYPSDSTWAASATKPEMQSIDQSKLVPLLVKTIQELEARITALES